MTAPILAAGTWRTNAELIADCARLGYLTEGGITWDGTWGEGTFWKAWRPMCLTATDMDPAVDAPHGVIDARRTQWPSGHFAHVVLDPPYKLNGTDQGEGHRYGVAATYRSVNDVLALMKAMLTEGARVLAPGGTLLYKCQDQVNAGAKVFQTDLVTVWAADAGLTKIDQFHYLAHRPQPQRSSCRWCGAKIMKRASGAWGTQGRSGQEPFGCTEPASAGAHEPDVDDIGQAHAHINYSTLLVFRKAT